jgi:hypothetical protein
LWPLRLTEWSKDAEISVEYPWFGAELWRQKSPEADAGTIEAALAAQTPYRDAEGRYALTLDDWCKDAGVGGLFCDAFLNQMEPFLDPPRLVMDVWLADAADRELYEKNKAAEEANLTTETQRPQSNGGMAMMMMPGDPCDTNEFKILEMEAGTNG